MGSKKSALVRRADFRPSDWTLRVNDLKSLLTSQPKHLSKLFETSTTLHEIVGERMPKIKIHPFVRNAVVGFELVEVLGKLSLRHLLVVDAREDVVECKISTDCDHLISS